MTTMLRNFIAVFVPRTNTVHTAGCHVITYMRPPLVYIEKWDSEEGHEARKNGKPCKMCNLEIPKDK